MLCVDPLCHMLTCPTVLSFVSTRTSYSKVLYSLLEASNLEEWPGVRLLPCIPSLWMCSTIVLDIFIHSQIPRYRFSTATSSL